MPFISIKNEKNCLSFLNSNGLLGKIESSDSSDVIWNSRFINLLNCFDDLMIYKFFNFDCIALFTIYDLISLNRYAEETDNHLIKGYLKSLPSRDGDEVVSVHKIEHHQYILMILHSFLKNKLDFLLNKDKNSKTEYSINLIEMLNLQKKGDLTIEFEEWFKGILKK